MSKKNRENTIEENTIEEKTEAIDIKSTQDSMISDEEQQTSEKAQEDRENNCREDGRKDRRKDRENNRREDSGKHRRKDREKAEKAEKAGEASEKEEDTVVQEEPEKGIKKPGSKAKWAVLGITLVLLLSLAGGYVGMAMYYRTHFFPGSSINGIECGNMEASEIASLVDRQIDTYSLQVLGRDPAAGDSSVLIGEIKPEDIALSYIDSMGSVESLLGEQNEWNWLQAYAGRTSYGYSLVQGVQFDENKLQDTVNSWEACRSENMQKPQDAFVSEYSDEIGGYQIIPEITGTELDVEKVLECISSGIYAKQTTVDLEQAACYAEPAVTQTDAGLTALVSTVNTWLGTEITYDWNGNEVVLGLEQLKDWIVLEEEGPVLDEEAVRSFVKEHARKYNTYGRKKKFVTALGIELTLDSPNYGWRTDTDAETEELIQLIYQGSKTVREPVYSVTAKEKGSRDIGGDYIEADLTHQHLYVFQDGQIAFETDFVSGKTNIVPSRATPPGIFGLTYKTRNATLRGTDYESFVNYWMPFYGNYGMHDATWRRDFGGTIFQDHGSHGCINLPLSSAAVIYEYVSTGFPVICYYYEVDPLAPPAETQMPSEEELRMQEEPVIGQETGTPGEGVQGDPAAGQGM